MSTVRRLFNKVFKGEDELDLTGGPIGYNLFHLALPIVVTNLLRTAYNLADTYWVGKLSTEALAAIGFAFPVIFFLISLGMGIAVAGSVLVAQNTGAGQDADASYAASQTVTFTVLFSIVFGTIGYLGVGPATRLLGASPEVLPLATAYLQIISAGIICMFGFAVFTALMRGYGDTVTPMVMMFATVVLNILLDPFLIFGWGPFPELGIEGAAIATVFSRGLAFVGGLAIMLGSDRGVTIRLDEMVPDVAFFRKMLRIGVPASIEGTGRSISVNLVLAIVGTFSTAVVAAYGVGIRVFITVFLPAVAVGRAVETMTGQNIGAGRVDRAREANHAAARWLLIAMSAAGLLVFLAAEPIIGVFTTDPQVVDVGARFMRIGALTFGGIGVMRAYSGGFRGVGKTLVAAAIAVLMLGIIRIPIAWFLSRAMGPDGIWTAFAISNVAGALIAYGWFRRSDWSLDTVDRTRQHQAEAAEKLVEYGDSFEAN